MTDQLTSQQLIDLIYAALNRRELALCDHYLVQLQAMSNQQDWVDLYRTIRVFMGDHDSGQAERALTALLTRTLDQTVRARALVALAKIYFNQGKWQAAIDTSTTALPLFADQVVEQARILQNIAVMYRCGFDQAEMGIAALTQAENHARYALDLLKAPTEPSASARQVQGFAWNTLGTIHLNRHEWEQALACYRHKLHICEELDDRQGLAEATKNIGEICHKQGDLATAAAHYQEALAYFHAEQNLSEIIDTQADLATLYQDLGDAPQALACYDAALQACDKLRQAITGSEARTAFAATVAEIYANTILFCVAQACDDQAFAYTEQARARALFDLLIGQQVTTRDDTQATYTDLATRSVTLAEIQAILPDDTLLLTYFTTGLYDSPKAQFSSKERLIRHRFPRQTTLLFVITTAACRVLDLALPPNHLLSNQLSNLPLRHLEQADWAQALYTKLLAPVEALLPTYRQVVIIPHGPLHYVPFHAITGATGNPLLAAQGPTVSYALSATVLRQIHQQRQKRAIVPGQVRCLAIGYNRDDSTEDTMLYFAEAEAQTIVQVIGGNAWTGATAKKAQLLAHADRYHYLHIACHGHFDATDPMASALVLAPNERLTADEVLHHLRLQCELVTLSACESGVGHVRRGDELMGFVRAFLAAGANTLLITLWQVDDLATYFLMQEFYRALNAGSAPAAALKQAQQYLRQLPRATVRTMITELASTAALDWHAPRFQPLLTGDAQAPAYADPKYWAAFVVVGGF